VSGRPSVAERVLRWPALGTTAEVVTTESAAGPEAAAIVRDELDAVDRACSRFREDSELSAVNARAGAPVAVGPLLREAVVVACWAAEVTGGLVDPTVGEALVLLGYDRSFADVAPHGPAIQVAARRVPGWRAVKVDHRSATVCVPAGVRLDLGATAKAWCADRAASLVTERLGTGVLVNLGGDVAIAGPAPVGGWNVRVTDVHSAVADAPGQTVVLESGGLATSGTLARRWARGGATLHHLVDPATGRPATGPWRTVTVAAASCLHANVAATASVILGVGAPEWLVEAGLPARLVRDDGTVLTVGGWPA
jgi:thiamine biosynthesis lipoprotein